MMKYTKKNSPLLSRLLGGLLGAVAFCAVLPGAALAGEREIPVSKPLRICGTLHLEDGRLMMTDIHGDTELNRLILNTSDETLILEAVNGYPVAKDSLKEGETVYAYISQAMALSEPPQSYTKLIVCQIPADFAAPLFETAESLEAQADSSFLLTTARGDSYRVDAATVLLPYLTRNIVTADDLTAGRTCLVWASQNSHADKIVIFPPAFGDSDSSDSSKPSGPASDPELTDKISLR